jgi:hypothetical protein
MTTPSRPERLRQAITAAAQNLAGARALAAQRSGPPAPGDLYLFRLGEGAALEWLVVREHPDDPGLLLMVPADDFPLAGTPDVKVPDELAHRPLSVRCGQGLWLPARQLEPHLRVGSLAAEALRQVRQKLAELARGQAAGTEEQRQTDLDPEYEDWLGEVELMRQRLQEQADQAGRVVLFSDLSRQPPPELATEPQLALAAEPGDELLKGLAEALAGATATVRYHEVALGGSGKLFLLADSEGVRAVWVGAATAAPALEGQQAPGQFRSVRWQAGPEGRLHRGEPLFPWIDQQVVFRAGTAPPQTVIIQR